ncbi:MULTISPECIES: hypothetical protein [Pseudomonas]|uniref:hypothetical protein n=1 Tax=Pseudomonas TaxID=286 RepID=UPI0005A81D9E|nr:MULTISPECIES: hypothetical protein [Pseudomonas]KAB0533972.1 hypothetical protein F7R16_07935 [Pseudomonas chlororaphis subsp. aureofaciens]QHC90590.1 hypothetical protein PchlR47_20500 [Pseudomonas chlororaphis]TSD26742.1 hypothetical protein FCE86_026725 [Pseudomonas sp. ATCC 13985]WDG46285.1 hypothetical protein PUP58_21350 [Pseudomonas chlororaphis]WDG58439.1 hypothetical protein PUP52_21715 [Pseudomonas chlororaphis]
MPSGASDQSAELIKRAQLVCSDASARRASLLSKKAEIDSELAQIDIDEAAAKQLLQALEQFSKQLEVAPAATPSTTSTLVITKNKIRTTGVKAAIVGATQELLQNGHPVRTKEIALHLQSQGLTLGEDTSKLEARISQILSADKEKRFVADRRVGWTLKERIHH